MGFLNMETLTNDFILQQKVRSDDLNHFPKTENELMKYFSEFSVEFFENGYELPKKVLEIIHLNFKSYLNCEIHIRAINHQGYTGKLSFVSKYNDFEKFTLVHWSELEK
jgi:hypothetical protein